ncbi:FtsX-like permease family protein [Actinospica robiniae]|uniref:FtsX-like permease family protein n=1 Tax=Actinospica robiniae TaxID=304901 RepID=UPI00040CB9C0|nr:FtsX-like permease family protein [Actinospica robiniae]
MKAWIGSWRFALRMARRQVPRSKARNALIVAMLALPVFGTVGVETLIHSAVDLTTPEQVTRSVGGFDAYIRASVDTPVDQSADGQQWESQPGTLKGTAGVDSTGVLSVLPSAALTPEQIAGPVYLDGAGGYAQGTYLQVDLGNPDTAGAFDVVSGRLPRTGQEIGLTPAMAADLGAAVGGRITLVGSSASDGTAATFTVVGLLELPDSTMAESAFALPAAPAAKHEVTAGWFVSNPGGVSWTQVQALNSLGHVVISRSVALSPPPTSQIPYEAHQFVFLRSGVPLELPQFAVPAAISGIAIGIGLLEVVLLAGPGFAVSARRREREYAMLGAAGADGGQVRRVVLADGIVLGAIAGVVGVGLGIGAAAAALPFGAHFSGRIPGALRIDVPHAVGVAVLAVLLGLCSALIPARGASRREIMATLSGRRTVVGRRRRRSAGVCGGLILAAAGLIGVYFGETISPGQAQLLITSGVALIEIGAILCTPAIVAGIASFGRWLPLGPRLALRDSARHSGRTTPAVAAMFAAVAGAVAAGAWLESSAAQQRAQYTPRLLPNQIAVHTDAADAPRILSALRQQLPDITGSVTLEPVAGYGQSSDEPIQWSAGLFTPGSTPGCAVNGVQKVLVDSDGMGICGDYLDPTAYEGELIGDGQLLRQVTGFEDAAADQVLAEGGIVVTTPGIVKDGTVGLVVQHDVAAAHATYATQTTEVYTLPAVYLNMQGKPDPSFVISPAAARKTGLDAPTAGQTALVVDLRQTATPQQIVRADEAMDGLHLNGDFEQDQGVIEARSTVNLIVLGFTVLLALAAAAIATGLALADGRADQQTLTAVGGSPWTRRWLAGSTALVITGMGVLIGVPIGFVVAAGLVRVSDFNLVGMNVYLQAMPFTVPWLNLVAMAAAVPVATAVGAMLLSRSNSPDRKLRLD